MELDISLHKDEEYNFIAPKSSHKRVFFANCFKLSKGSIKLLYYVTAIIFYIFIMYVLYTIQQKMSDITYNADSFFVKVERVLDDIDAWIKSLPKKEY